MPLSNGSYLSITHSLLYIDEQLVLFQTTSGSQHTTCVMSVCVCLPRYSKERQKRAPDLALLFFEVNTPDT